MFNLKQTMSAVAIAFFGASALAAGHTEGNGGAGCIATDGHVITFYNCGVYKAAPRAIDAPDQPSPIDAPSERPPGLEELKSFIQNFGYLYPETKNKIIKSIEPTIYRKYFSTVPGNLNSQVQNRILFQFKRATGLDPQHLQLFGITDTNAKISYISHPAQITYLLPGFYSLRTTNEQMVALFHEAWWVSHADATESDVVQAEMIFQALLEAPSDASRQLKFVQLFEEFESSNNVVRLTLKTDIESGALRGFVNDQNQITNWQLFGQENILCFNENHLGAFSPSPGLGADTCILKYISFLNEQRRQYPNSLFFESIGKYFIALKEKDKIRTIEEVYSMLTRGVNDSFHLLFKFMNDWNIYDLAETNQIILQINTNEDDSNPFSRIGKPNPMRKSR